LERATALPSSPEEDAAAVAAKGVRAETAETAQGQAAMEGTAEFIEERAVDELAVELYREHKAAGGEEPLALLCGDAAVVHSLRRRLFMAGLSSRRIVADAFVPTPDGDATIQAAV